MSRVPACLVAILLASPAHADAILRGRVLAADSGQPLRRAQVRIALGGPVAGGPPQNRATTTDSDGRYEFNELKPGRYTVSASKGSYIALSYGQRRPNEPGKPIEILDGQTVEKVDFALPRGAILTGRILDEFGEPAEGAQVAPMQVRTIQDRPQMISAGRVATTNDLGEFRIIGVPPGQYFLSATMRGTIAATLENDDRSGYAPTFYPGTSSLGEAQRLTLAVGQTISDLAMVLVPTRTARVTGVVLDSQGRPMTNGNILVMQRNNGLGLVSMVGAVKPDGSFSLSGLAPGDYLLSAAMPAGFGDESANAQVTVDGQDINGLQMFTAKPSTLTGRVVSADAGAAQTLRPSAVLLGAMPRDPEPIFGGNRGPVRVNDDGTFAITSRPGVTRLMLASSLPDWTLKAVRLNGVDVTDSGVDVRGNEDIGGFEVELTNHLTSLSGLVTNGRGDYVADYFAIVFSQNRDKWSVAGRYVRTIRPGQDGRYTASGLPAGDYFAIAVDAVDPAEAASAEFLDHASSRAVRFSLNDAETKSLDLKLSAVDY
jgi:carboxypeptidase family protein